MTNYWKKRFYKKNRELHKQRKQMKILLGCTITLALIFGTLIVIGYTAKQMQTTATKTIDSFSVQIINAINSYQDIIITIVAITIVILIILLIIWSWIPKQTTTGVGGYSS